MLSLEVKLSEIPDEPTADETLALGADPMAMLGKMASRVMASGAPGTIYPMPRMPGGLDFRKAVAVTVPSVAGLGKICEQFDQLAEQIQVEHP